MEFRQRRRCDRARSAQYPQQAKYRIDQCVRQGSAAVPKAQKGQRPGNERRQDDETQLDLQPLRPQPTQKCACRLNDRRQ
ncbi:MAG: hypothetical protein Q8Q79_07560, partial [Sphingopyxis sp.]|nr:hypothetical protein [Sphingopyxis sp.]